MTASRATQSEAMREVIRRYMTRGDIEQPVRLSVEELSTRFNASRDAVRTALKGLAGETGRGVHQIGGDIFEYRAVERQRKVTDTQVRVKAARYMQQTKPGSLHMVADVAKAINALPASTSGALKAVSQDPYLHIIKVSWGTYSYRPPVEEPVPENEPAALPPVLATGAHQPPTPAQMPQHRLPLVVDLSDGEPERPTPRLDKLVAVPEPIAQMWDGQVPPGYLKVIHTTSKGVRLAEDHEGRLHKVISIEEDL